MPPCRQNVGEEHDILKEHHQIELQNHILSKVLQSTDTGHILEASTRSRQLSEMCVAETPLLSA